jgi:hypothetical protein
VVPFFRGNHDIRQFPQPRRFGAFPQPFIKFARGEFHFRKTTEKLFLRYF